MRRGISRRVERLEQVAGIRAAPLPNIFFFFTNEKVGSPLRAESNGLAWQRESDEAERDFQDRVVRDLGMAGHRPPYLIILSDHDAAEA